ncbi:MAG: hypothetical protein NVSMB68_05410 [Thermoanaerobaculia bacterium]
MKQALSALANSGKYSATTFNLAFYLSDLLKKEFESEALEREKESKVSVAPYIEGPAAPAATIAPLPPPPAPLFLTSPPQRKSKAPIAIAAAVLIALIGAGAFVALGSKKQDEPVTHLASATPTPPPPVRQPVIPDPILATPAQPASTASSGIADATAQKKAFENAVKEKLRSEMMKLQSAYTKQLQQQQAKNAPLAVAPAPFAASTAGEPRPVERRPAESRAPDGRAPEPRAPEPRAAEPRAAEPSAARLDERQRDTPTGPDVPKPVSTSISQTVAPLQQQAAAPQIREGDVVDIGSLDVAPRRTRDPRVVYPPMAARQRIETNVLTSVLISENGDVLDVKVLRGDERFGFTDAAVRALRSAHYSSPMKDGKRVKTWLPQIIQFKPGA